MSELLKLAYDNMFDGEARDLAAEQKEAGNAKL